MRFWKKFNGLRTFSSLRSPRKVLVMFKFVGGVVIGVFFGALALELVARTRPGEQDLRTPEP